MGILWFCRDSEPEDRGGGRDQGQEFSFLPSPVDLPEGGLHTSIIELGWRGKGWTLPPVSFSSVVDVKVRSCLLLWQSRSTALWSVPAAAVVLLLLPCFSCPAAPGVLCTP